MDGADGADDWNISEEPAEPTGGTNSRQPHDEHRCNLHPNETPGKCHTLNHTREAPQSDKRAHRSPRSRQVIVEQCGNIGSRCEVCPEPEAPPPASSNTTPPATNKRQRQCKTLLFVC